MKEPTYSQDTMNMQGPLCDGSTADYLMYCDALCAEQAECTEDSLFEALAGLVLVLAIGLFLLWRIVK